MCLFAARLVGHRADHSRHDLVTPVRHRNIKRTVFDLASRGPEYWYQEERHARYDPTSGLLSMNCCVRHLENSLAVKLHVRIVPSDLTADMLYVLQYGHVEQALLH